MFLQELDVSQTHLSWDWKKAATSTIPSPIQESGIDTTTATHRWTYRQVAEAADSYNIGCDETSDWCNSFILMPKANGKIQLVIDPASWTT